MWRYFMLALGVFCCEALSGEEVTSERFAVGEPIRFVVRIPEVDRALYLGVATDVLETAIDHEFHDLFPPEQPGKYAPLRYHNVTKVVSPQRVQVGSLEVPRSSWVVVRLDQLQRAANANPIHGVLGMNDLVHFVLHIGFEQGRAKLSTVSFDGTSDGYQRVLMPTPTAYGILPLVDVKLGGEVPGYAMVGVGREVSLSVPERWLDYTISKGLTRSIDRIDQTTDPPVFTPVKLGRMPLLKLGRFSLREVVVICEDDATPVIGDCVWRRFQLVIDFPKGTLWLKPNARLGESDNRDAFGLWGYGIPEGLRIDRVTKGSKAEQVGIRPGDIVCEIDRDKLAGKMEAAMWRRLWYPAGTSIQVKLIRGGKSLDVVFDLSDGR